MTKDEAMKLALEALEYIYNGANNQGPHTGISWRCVLNKAEPVITALREALAKPDFWEGYVPEPTVKQSLTVDQPAHPEQMARLGWQYVECPACGLEGARAFPKPEEPVAWIKSSATEWSISFFKEDGYLPLYTSPPQRTWVGVTWTDREKLRDRYGWNYPPLLVDAVSDILEWKNT